MASFNDINNDRLIDAVERRQPLYVKAMKEHSDCKVKQKLWNEVCAMVFDNWNDLTPHEKLCAGRDVQRRWQNLRSCFSREVRIQQKITKSGQATSKRRKYIYFDRLLFLLPTIDQRLTENGGSTLQNESRSEESNAKHRTVSGAQHFKCPSTTRLNKVPYEDYLIELSSVQKAEKPVDEDINFAMSLVPSLRALSYDKKLEAKIEILNVLRRMGPSQSTNSSTPLSSASSL